MYVSMPLAGLKRKGRLKMRLLTGLVAVSLLLVLAPPVREDGADVVERSPRVSLHGRHEPSNVMLDEELLEEEDGEQDRGQ